MNNTKMVNEEAPTKDTAAPKIYLGILCSIMVTYRFT